MFGSMRDEVGRVFAEAEDERAFVQGDRCTAGVFQIEVPQVAAGVEVPERCDVACGVGRQHRP